MIYEIIDNKRIVNASIILMGLSIFTVIMYQFQSFLMPFTVALVLTFLFMPTYRLLQKKKIYKFYFVLICLALILLTIITSSLIAGETKSIDIDNSTDTITKQLNSFEGMGIELGPYFISFDELSKNEEITAGIEKIISSLVSTIGNFLSQFMIVILFLMFMLPSHDILVRNLSKKMKRESRKRFKNSLDKIEQGIRDYLTVKSTVSAITAFVSLVVLLIFGVKYPMLFMLLIFILNFIPNIGSFIAVGLVLVVHFFAVGFSLNFTMVSVLLILIQIVMGNIIEPKISGKKMNLSPIVILLSLFFWGYLWGAWGMFFAVPLTVIVKITLENLAEKSIESKKA